MGAWDTLAQHALALLDRHALLAGALILLADEAGVPTPFPANLIIVALGVRAGTGALPFWQVVLALEAATVVGATVLYTLAGLAGRRLVYRYGKYVGLTRERVQSAEGWVRPRGARAVILGRLVPGLRNVTPIASGVLSIPLRVFLPGMSLGALLYILILAGFGYFAGPPILNRIEQIAPPLARILG